MLLSVHTNKCVISGLLSVWIRTAVCATIYPHPNPDPNPNPNPILNPKPNPNPKSYHNLKLFNE